jgi:hypothetical protein
MKQQTAMIHVPDDVALAFGFRNIPSRPRARHRIARANRQKSGSATGLVIVTGAGSSAANRLSGISFISHHALGNEDGTAEAHVGAKNARIETGNIVRLQCRSSP